jgi:hypothetical protein
MRRKVDSDVLAAMQTLANNQNSDKRRIGGKVTRRVGSKSGLATFRQIRQEMQKNGSAPRVYTVMRAAFRLSDDNSAPVHADDFKPGVFWVVPSEEED